MRMRKKKWAEPFLSAHDEIVIHNPSELKGKWRTVCDKACMHVEIGMGKGGYIFEMAKKYPEVFWVGIEKDVSAAAVAARLCLSEGIPENIKLIAGNADKLSEWFAENEIDVIHLNFSDPWPKKKYHKRRLSSQSFLDMYKSLLKPTGEIQMKTDNKDLFEDSVCYFVKDGWKFKDFSVDFRRVKHDEDVKSEYESKFVEQGLAIYRFVAVYEDGK